MGSGTLTIDLDAIAANWRALDRMTPAATETAAVVKADAYGLGIDRVAPALARAGVRSFFVAVAGEGVALRRTLGPGPLVSVMSGHMPGDTAAIRDAGLTPMLNSVDQLTRQFETLPGAPFGVQIDTGMARLGMPAAEWLAVAAIALDAGPRLVMSHLACADTPAHPMNAHQLAEFRDLTDGIGVPRSLAATGGILLGADFHFDHTRPGIGLFGAAPFADAQPVVRLSLPVIQTRQIAAGDSVGYGCTFVAQRPSVIATVSGGYADGLLRAIGGRARLFAGDTACAIVGRVSMDLITADVTDLAEVPDSLDILCPHQGVDALAAAAGTIGYEILTSLGARYARHSGPVASS